MPVVSKTGLLVGVRKKVRYEVQPKTTLDVSNIATPAPFVLRPFAGIYNPFPYGCSVLCNHPTDVEVKTVVKKAKDTWAIEGRALLSSEDLKIVKCHKFQRNQRRRAALADTVPEELFRRYTDTDSRPITPAPTVTSLASKHVQYLKKRRCMTPDPVPSFPNKERKLLVLDLRRSHSQETITWIGSQHGESVMKIETAAETSRTASSLSRRTTSSKKKRQSSKREEDVAATPAGSKFDTQRSEKNAGSRQPYEGRGLLVPELVADNRGAANSGSSSDAEVVKRRGKRKKGKKSAKEGEKEFQGFPEPGETQVSALGNESRMGSSRPSLTASTAPDEAAEAERLANEAGKSTKKSFLDADILKHLQRQIDHEVVESELNAKKKIALEEALRLVPKTKPSKQNQEIKAMKKELRLSASNPEKWLSIPRVFTRQSARFELPMDSRILNDLTPLQYAERYVFPSEERLVLYNHVFNLHMEEFDEDEGDAAERTLLGKNVIAGLGDIMGRAMTPQEGDEFRALMGFTDDMCLDFRAFAGMSAVCERIFARRFCSEMPSPKEDLKHEVERADFETLDRKLLYVKPDRRIVRILKGIRDL